MGNPANVVTDVGTIWVAPTGTTEPTGNATAQPGPITGFRAVGYTQKGTNATPYKPVVSPEFVEEEIYPVRQVVSQVDGDVMFIMAENTRQNLALAINKGANAANDATSLEPPSPGTELAVMIMWEALSGARQLYRSCIQSGAITLNRNKAPAYTLIAVSFMLQKPAGLQPFITWPAASFTV